MLLQPGLATIFYLLILITFLNTVLIKKTCSAYLSFGYMYADIVFVNPFSIMQSMFIFLDYILNEIYIQYKKKLEHIKPYTDLNASYCICISLHI